MAIHPTAILGPKVELGVDVQIGPYAVLDGEARIGAGTRIGPHAHITGFVTMGEACVVHAGAVLGGDPQDLSFEGKKSEVVIGARCVFRECVTVHRGTKEGTSTVLGDDCYLMAYSHVGHNCRVGNNVILVNGCSLGGYVEVGDRAFLSAGAEIHQFCRIGTLAIVGGATKVDQDIPPYALVDGHPPLIHATNVVGLRRAGFNEEARRTLKEAYRILFRRDLPQKEALEEIERTFPGEATRVLVEFIRASKRGICHPA